MERDTSPRDRVSSFGNSVQKRVHEVSDDHFSPSAKCKLAQCMTICYRYVVVRDLGMVMSALTLMASLVQAGVACGVIYRLNELQYYNNYSNGFQKTIKQTVKDQIPSRFDLKSIVRALDDIPNAVYEWGTDQVSNAIGKTWENIEERLCFNLYRSEFYGKALAM